MSTCHGTLIQSPFRTAIQAVCRLDLRIICGGHKAASAALALLIRWTETKIEDFQRENDTYAIPDADDLWLTGNTISRITNWMGGWFDEKTVRAGLSILEDLGYIDRRQDGGTDRTIAYLVNQSTIQDRLSAITVEEAAKYIGREKAAETLGKVDSGKSPDGKGKKPACIREYARLHPGKSPDDLYQDTDLDSYTDKYPPTPQGGESERVAPLVSDLEPELNPEAPESLASQPDQKKDSSTQRGSGSGTKSSAARRRKPKKADDIYAMLTDRGGFESYWEWYRTKICPIRKIREGVSAEEGSKAKAAWAWYQLEASDFLGQGREGFREGCRLQAAKYASTGGIGIPNGCRFLLPGTGEPPWLQRLQEKDTPDVEDFLPDEPSPVVPIARGRMSRSEQVSLNNQQVLDEWKRKKRAEMDSQQQQTVEVSASYV